MGKALIAVGTFLCVCFLIFGGVVYFTRDEDTYAVDSVLSQSITKELAEAEQRHAPVDFRNLVNFDYDKVLIFKPNTPKKAISAQLGFPFKGELRYTAETSEIFVFTNRGHFVRFADYRGRLPFEGLTQPFDYITANDTVFTVKGGVIRFS